MPQGKFGLKTYGHNALRSRRAWTWTKTKMLAKALKQTRKRGIQTVCVCLDCGLVEDLPPLHSSLAWAELVCSGLAMLCG